MKTLLIAPYKKSYSGLAKFPPLGLGYLATALRNNNQEVELIDCLKEGVNNDSLPRYLKQKNPQVVGINTWSLAIKEVEEILKTVKEVDRKIVTVIGGPHPSAVPEEAMKFFGLSDFGFIGEGEIGLPMLVKKLQGQSDIEFNNIPGLMWRQNGTLKINKQIFYEDLDSFDSPAWDLIEPRDYCQPGSITSGKTAPIITTRGCPYLCTFCAPHIIAGRRVRRRSADKIISEIKLLKDKYSMTTIAVMDENFTFYRDHVVSLCSRLIKERINMEFFLPNGIRLDTLDEELLLLMRKAGFLPSVAVGIESGSERILKIMKKSLNKETVKEKIKLMIKCGFRPIGYFILGFPQETKEEMYETLKFAKELKLYRAGFSPLLVLPGTGIYNDLKESGQLPKDYDFTRLLTDNITRAPDGMTPEEFLKIKKDIIFKFNMQPRVILDYMRDLNSFIFATLKFKEIFLKKTNKH